MSDEIDKMQLPVSVVIPTRIDPDSLDELTARIKVKMVDELTLGGRVVPTDEDGVNTMLKVLNALDSQTSNRRKHVIEERAVDAATQTAANVAEIIKQAKGHPFLVQPSEREIHGERVRNREPDLPDHDPVDRQDFIGIDNLQYDDFVNENRD